MGPGHDTIGGPLGGHVRCRKAHGACGLECRHLHSLGTSGSASAVAVRPLPHNCPPRLTTCLPLLLPCSSEAGGLFSRPRLLRGAVWRPPRRLRSTLLARAAVRVLHWVPGMRVQLLRTAVIVFCLLRQSRDEFSRPRGRHRSNVKGAWYAARAGCTQAQAL